jgi:carbon monoxide dehydrogenase subunit G
MTGAPAPGASNLDRPSFRLPFTIAHSLPGRLRLRLNPPGEESHLKGAASALEAVDGVKRVYIRVAGRSLIVEYERAGTNPQALLEAAVSAVPDDYGFKTVEAEMSVPAPVNRVWEVIVDPRYFTLHLPEAVHVTDIRDSSHWLVEFKALRRRFQLEVRVVERWPEQRVVLHAEGSFTAKITITLTESGSSTLVRERVEYLLPPGMLAALIGRFSSTRLRNGLLSHLATVAALASEL